MPKVLRSHHKKIRTRRALKRLSGQLRKSGKTVVFTNGCFDILHVGHVSYLQKARQLGDVLVVGVNSDTSVRLLKGPERPINPEQDRLKVVSALEAVDYVTLFPEETPLNLICEIRPDVLAKGADWEKNKIVGAKEVESWGGKVKQIPWVPGRSTTAVIEKMRSR